MSISMTRVVASRSASSEGKEEEGAAAAAEQAGFRASVTCGRAGGNENSLVFLVGIFFGCA